VNIANNIVQGQATGPTVLVLPNGHQPQEEIGYGNARSIAFTGLNFVLLTGSGAVVTYTVLDRADPIAAVTVPVATLAPGSAVTLSPGSQVENVPLSSQPTPVTVYGPNAVTFVAAQSADANGASSKALPALTTNPGGAIVVFVQVFNGPSASGYNTVSGISDGNSNSYALVSGGKVQWLPVAGYYYDTEVWLATGIAGSSNTITVTASASSYLSILAISVSGPATLDSIGAYVYTPSAGTYTTTDTVVAQSALLLGLASGNANSTPISPPTPMIGAGTYSASTYGVVSGAYQANVGAGVQSRQWNYTASNPQSQLILLALASTQTPQTVNGLGDAGVIVEPAQSKYCAPGTVGATATAVKTSAGVLRGYALFNSSTSWVYVQVFNKTTGSITLGSTAPDLVIGLPPGGGANLSLDGGIVFGTAISWASTATPTGSGAPAADPVVNFWYT